MKNESCLLQPTSQAPVAAPLTADLPFRVRLVANERDLLAAVEIRASAYRRHVPSMHDQLKSPEPDDRRADVLCLLAERKSDGRPVGTLRLQSNCRQPLRIQSEIALPHGCTHGRLVEFVRLGVAAGSDGVMVSWALAKAGLIICQQANVDTVLVAGRSTLRAFYESLAFEILNEGVAADVNPPLFAGEVADLDVGVDLR